MFWGYRHGQIAAVLLALLLSSAASTLNTSYLLPGHEFKIQSGALGGAKFCALTFDDGPDANYTMQVAKILSERGVRATFFVVGRNAAAYPEQVQALAAAGFEIGNHSWSHPDFTRLSAASQREQLEKTSNLLAKLGVSTRWFRPPYGAFNRTTLKSSKELGLVPMLWTVDPRDWAEPGTSTIVSRVGKQTVNGAVILLHSTHAQSVKALPGIIDLLQERGYAFLTLSEWEKAVQGQGLPAPSSAQPLKLPLEQSLRPMPVVPAEASANAEAALPEVPLRGDSLDTQTSLDPESPSAMDAGVPVPLDAGVFETAAQQSGQAQSEGDITPPASGQLLLQTPAQASGQAAGAWLKGGAGLSRPGASSALATALPEATVRMLSFANFEGPAGIRRIWRDGEADELRGWGADAALFMGGSSRSAVKGKASSELQDTPVAAGQVIPGLPEGEELVIPPDQPVFPSSAPKVLPTPMGLIVSDLVDPSNPRTGWQAPDSIDSSNFDNHQALAAGQAARAYFLSIDPALTGYTAVELDSYLRLARLSGLVIASDFGCPVPDCSLPFAWQSYSYSAMDRGGMLDLTVEGVPEAIDALARGKENLFVVVRPQNLHFFIAAHTLSEMSPGMRDFVLFRQATAGLAYDTPTELLQQWQLPAGVQLARFSSASREAIVLYSGKHQPTEVEVPSDFRYMSLMSLDPGGYLRIAQLQGVTVQAGRTPAILYYEKQ